MEVIDYPVHPRHRVLLERDDVQRLAREIQKDGEVFRARISVLNTTGSYHLDQVHIETEEPESVMTRIFRIVESAIYEVMG